jgi:SulP family sulfate permease
MSEVKGPVMDRLKRSDFFEHFTGKVFLSQYEAATALSAPGPGSPLPPAVEVARRNAA